MPNNIHQTKFLKDVRPNYVPGEKSMRLRTTTITIIFNDIYPNKHLTVRHCETYRQVEGQYTGSSNHLPRATPIMLNPQLHSLSSPGNLTLFNYQPDNFYRYRLL